MRQGNLGAAVTSTLKAVDTKLKYQQQELTTVASQRIDPVMFTNPNHSPSVAKFEIVGFLCLLSAVVLYLISKMMEPVKNGPRDPVIKQAYDDQTNGVSWNPKTQSYNTDRWVNGVRNRSGNSVSDSSDGSSSGSSDSGSSSSSDGGGSW